MGISGDVQEISYSFILRYKVLRLMTMAENAQKDACMLTNPRKANLEQVIGIYKAAM